MYDYQFLSYVIQLSRFSLLIVFFISFTGKVRAIAEFYEAISKFKLLQGRANVVAAYIFLFAELAIIILLTVGINMLKLGFIGVVLLILVFTGALVSVLIRQIRTKCNCFGTAQKEISHYDIYRNILLISIGIIGWLSTMFIPQGRDISLRLFEWVLIGLVSIPTALVMTYFGDLAHFISESE